MSDGNIAVKNRAFDFATVGFRPYVYTKEFVTIGVVARDTATGEFGYSLLDENERERIDVMFPKLGAQIYTEARKKIASDLAFARNDKNCTFSFTPREGVICFPVQGRRLAESMPDALASLKEKFVEQNVLVH